MSIAPSKKKLEPSSSSKAHIDVLENLANRSDGETYSMLMQICKKSMNDECFQTPMKKSKTRKTNIFWTISTQATFKSKQILSPQNSIKRLSGMRHRIEARRQKINILTVQIQKICDYRLKVNKYKIQMLESLKSRQQISKLYKEEKLILQQIENQIEEIKKQALSMQKQVQKGIESINCLDSKFKQMNENYQRLGEIKSNLTHAVSSQLKKNNILKTKLENIQSLIIQKNIIQKLSTELFVSLLLRIQISNNIYNKKDLRNSIVIDLCVQNQLLKKVHFGFIVLAKIHMQTHLSKIDPKYLNKISYFCEEAKIIFKFDRFRQMIQNYFQEKFITICKKHESPEEKKTKQSLFKQKNQKSCQDFELEQRKDQIQRQNNSFQLTINMSENCSCGQKLKQLFSEELFRRVLHKFFSLQTIKVKNIEKCSFIQLSSSEFKQNHIQEEMIEKNQENTIFQR